MFDAGSVIARFKADTSGFDSSLKKAGGTIDGLQSRIDRLQKLVNKSDIGSERFKNLSAELERTKSAMDRVTGSSNLLMKSLSAAAILSVGNAVVQTSAKFEKYNAVLTNSLQSQTKAAAAMALIEKIAAKTPFSVDELTASYIKFINRGISPTEEELIKLGDVAASQGKSFDQLTEAILDATSGEFERLKEFGIRASAAGDQVQIAFRGVNLEVAKTPEAIQEAIVSLGGLEGVSGSMAAISGTLEGRFSNLGDATDQLKKNIGDALAPAVKTVTELLIRLVSSTATFVKDNKELISTIAILVGSFVALKGSVALFTTILATVGPLFTSTGVAAAAAFGPASLAYLAIAGIVALMYNLDSAAKAARESIAKISQELNKGGSVTQAQKSSLEGLASALVNVEKNSASARVVQQQFAKAVDEAKGIMPEYRAQLKLWSESAISSKSAAESLKTEISKLDVAQKENTKTTKAYSSELKKTGSGLETTVEEINKAAQGATNSFGGFVEKTINGVESILKAFDENFEGLSEEVKAFIVQISNAIGEIAAAGINNFFQRMQNQLQSAQRKIQAFRTLASVFSEYLRRQQEREYNEAKLRLDKELEEYKKREEEKLNAVRDAERAKVEALEAAKLQRDALADQEIADAMARLEQEKQAFIAQQRLIFEQRQANLIANAETQAQERLAKEANEQDWLAFLERVNSDYLERQKEITQTIRDEQVRENETATVAIENQNAESNSIIEKEEKESAERIRQEEQKQADELVAIKQRQELEKRNAEKVTAALRYTLEVAALEIQKQTARASAALTFAQATAAAVLAGISITAALAPYAGLAAIAIGGTTTLALGALAASTYSLQMASIGSQFVVPPAELFLEDGGVVGGRRHSNGGTQMGGIEAERRELFIDRGRTARLFEWMDNGMGGGVTINMYEGAFQGVGDLSDASIQIIGEKLGRVVERRSY